MADVALSIGGTSRVRWKILALIFLISTITYLDRVNVSIATRYITSQYNLSDVEMGKVFSAFILAYGLFQVPGGWLGDRFGPRVVLTGAVLWWSAFTSMTALAHWLTPMLAPVSALILIRFCLGAGEAAAWPNFNRTIANWIPASERGFAASVPLTGGSLGAALAPPLIAFVMLKFGWAEAFHVCAAIGVVGAIAWYSYVRDTPQQHKGVSSSELALISQDRSIRPVVRKTPWKAIFTNKNAWLLFLSAMTCGYLVYIYMSWFYVYLVEERKLSLMKGSIYTTGPFIAMSIMTPFGGLACDMLVRRYGKTFGRRAISMSGMIVSALALFIGVHTPNINIAIIGLSVGAGAIYFALASHWATTIDISKEHAGTVSGIMNWGGNMGGMVSPILTPILVHRWGWRPAFDIAGLVILCGAFIWLLVEPERLLKDEAKP
jgi:MFS transporter, ACS family, glucarate transporter